MSDLSALFATKWAVDGGGDFEIVHCGGGASELIHSLRAMPVGTEVYSYMSY